MNQWLLLIGMALLVSCASNQEKPSQAQDKQENVYHVFDQDLKVQAKEKRQKTKVKQDTIEKVKGVEDGPLQIVKQYTAQLQALDEESKNDSDRNKKIANTVRSLFDFQTLAKESLGSHWYQINKADQVQYSDLFIELIERSYLARSKDLVGNYDLYFSDEKIMPNKAQVSCVVKKEDVDIDITYELHQRAGKWVIYNIIFDNVNLIKNYQSQFGRIIAKNKFSGLVETMEKKLKSDDENVVL